MKATKKKNKAVLSVFLTILFVVQLVPVQVLSADKTETDNVQQDSVQTASEPTEIVELRDAFTKHYRSPEGQYYAEVHAQPVHYKQDGTWKDYDLSLQTAKSGDGYAVRKTDTPVTFPQSFAADNKITVSHGAYSIGFGVSATNVGFNNKAAARTVSAAENAATASGELRYADVLPNTDVTYTVLPNGVKENIVVHQKQNAYRYTFDMDFGGLLPALQDDGTVYLLTAADAEKPTFVIDAPFMVDDAGQYSEALTLSVQGSRLTLEADVAWVNAEERVFPVTIDPYCYVPASGSGYIHTGYVTNLQPNRNYVGKVSTGRNGLYADRTYFKFDFPSLSPNYTFYSASLVLYQISGTNPSGNTNYIDLYDLSNYPAWEYDEITWNDQPVSDTFGSYVGTPILDYCTLSADDNVVYTYDISDAAAAYYAHEEDNGYLLAMRQEIKGDFSWMGEVGGAWGTPPFMHIYYTRPCICCGDKCVYESANGSSCSCTCTSWEDCNCPQCGHYCACKSTCKYGEGCGCTCLSEAVCNCVACKGYSHSIKDEDTGDVTSYIITDGTKTMTETYTYNTDHAVTGMTDANGNTVQYTYAAGSEQPSAITMGTSTVNYTYNSDDLLTGVSQNVTGLSAGTAIANGYTYNADKNVTSISHNDFAYNFVYDANGNNTQVKVGNQPLAEYTYDANGNITMVKLGTYDLIYYTYDSENRVTQMLVRPSWNGPYSSDFSFTYDNDGNLSTITDAFMHTRTVYNEYGTPGYTVYDTTTNDVLYAVEYADEGDPEQVVSYGGWGSVTVEPQESEFDFETGETTYTENISTDGSDMVSALVYDFFGRKTGGATESIDALTQDVVTLTESVGYNDTATTAGTLPTTYSSTVEADNVTAEAAFRYTYDSRGNITAVYDTTATPETLLARYAYDEANQLVREDNVQLGKTVTYTYDKGGNITQKTEYAFTTGTPGTATDTITYTYDSVWKDRLASYDGTDIEYDEIGNPWEYTHDRYLMWQGRELRYFDTDDGYVEYRYNQDGLRCQKVFEEIGTGLEDRYDYYWTDDCRLQGYTVTMAGSTEPYSVLVLYNSAQEPIGFTVGEHTYYYIKNIQGDVLTVTDAEGTPIVNYTYDAWGAMTVSPASQNVTSQTVVNVAFLNPVTYRGYFYDYELGLYYLQSRYYDPETGRFVSIDITCDSGNSIVGPNLFIYGENEPTVAECSDGEETYKYNFFGFGKNELDFKTPWKAKKEPPQKVFGYCNFYDTLAKHSFGFFSLDYLVSEFEHDSKKWRVEFWKGRYFYTGIGAEIGFYYKTQNDSQILPYRCSLDQLFEMRFELYSCYGEKELICERNEKHWWLAGIVVNPVWALQGKARRLSMSAKIEFLDSDMARQFLDNINHETLDGYYDNDKSLESTAYVGIKWTEKECDLDKLDYLT